MYSSNSAILIKLGIETVALNFKTGILRHGSLDKDLCPLLVQCLPASFPCRWLWPCPLPGASLFTIFLCLYPLQLTWSIWEDQDDPSTWHISPSCLLWLTTLYSSDLSLNIFVGQVSMAQPGLVSLSCAAMTPSVNPGIALNTHTLLYLPIHLPVWPTTLQVPWGKLPSSSFIIVSPASNTGPALKRLDEWVK